MTPAELEAWWQREYAKRKPLDQSYTAFIDDSKNPRKGDKRK